MFRIMGERIRLDVGHFGVSLLIYVLGGSRRLIEQGNYIMVMIDQSECGRSSRFMTYDIWIRAMLKQNGYCTDVSISGCPVQCCFAIITGDCVDISAVP